MNDLASVHEELEQAVKRLEERADTLRAAGREFAAAEAFYRLAKAMAFARVADRPNAETRQADAERELIELPTANTDGETSTQAHTLNLWRYKRDLAREEKGSAWQSMEAAKAVVSGLQSLVRAHTAEADLARYGPDVTP